MGRKGTRGGNGRRSESPSSCSETSSCSGASEATSRQDAASFDELADALTSKKVKDRSIPLKALHALLCRQVATEELANWTVTLSSALWSCVKKADAACKSMALGCLTMLVVTAADDVGMLEECRDKCREMLKPSALGSGSKAAIAAAAATLLSVCSVLLRDPIEVSADGGVIRAALATLGAKANDTTAAVPVAIMGRSFCLLAASLPAKTICQDAGPPLDCLVPLLESEDTGVRSAAAECVATLYDAHYRMHPPAAPADDSLEAISMPVRPQADTVFDSHYDAVVEIVSDWMSDSCKRRAKEDRRITRKLMRDILAVVEGRGIEETKITVGHVELRQTGWLDHARLAGWRSALGPGLFTHLAENPAVKGMVGVWNTADKTVVELGSETEKRRAAARRKERRQAEDARHAGMEEFDDM